MPDDQAAQALRLLDALIRSSGQTVASLQARSPRLRGLEAVLEEREELTLRLLLEALHHLEVPDHLYFGALFPAPSYGDRSRDLVERLQARGGETQGATPEIPVPTEADLEARIRIAIEQALGR